MIAAQPEAIALRMAEFEMRQSPVEEIEELPGSAAVPQPREAEAAETLGYGEAIITMLERAAGVARAQEGRANEEVARLSEELRRSEERYAQMSRRLEQLAAQVAFAHSALRDYFSGATDEPKAQPRAQPEPAAAQLPAIEITPPPVPHWSGPGAAEPPFPASAVAMPPPSLRGPATDLYRPEAREAPPLYGPPSRNQALPADDHFTRVDRALAELDRDTHTLARGGHDGELADEADELDSNARSLGIAAVGAALDGSETPAGKRGKSRRSRSRKKAAAKRAAREAALAAASPPRLDAARSPDNAYPPVPNAAPSAYPPPIYTAAPYPPSDRLSGYPSPGYPPAAYPPPLLPPRATHSPPRFDARDDDDLLRRPDQRR